MFDVSSYQFSVDLSKEDIGIFEKIYEDEKWNDYNK